MATGFMWRKGQSMTDDSNQQNARTVLTSAAGHEPFEILTRDDTEYYVLGTAHVSQTSATTVGRLIDTDLFDAVAVELCGSRHEAITNTQAWQNLDLFDILRQGKGGMMMASLAMSAYQRRIAEQLGIEPGAEMRMAIEAANQRKLPLWLIDREIGITLKRASAHMGWWKKWVMLNGLFFSLFSRESISEQEIEELKQGDLLDQTFSQFAEATPELYESLIAERDCFMAAKLKVETQTSQQAMTGPKRVLVVIGAGHMAGMLKALAQQDDHPERTIAQLEATQTSRSFLTWLPWLILVVVISGFVFGFSKSPELGWALVTTWVVVNGSLSAFGALLARAHPLTILTALVAAPLTSLNPTVGAGMVTGVVEAWLRKPRVTDFEGLREDVATLKGWYRNRISHVFLVFFGSNLGSAAGTWIAGFSMFSQLTSGS